MKNLDTLAFVAYVIVLIGGLILGLLGLFNTNLILAIFGTGLFARLIFIIIGVAAGYLCYLLYVEKFKKPNTPTG